MTNNIHVRQTQKTIHRTELYEDKAINMCADKVRIQRNVVKHSHFIVIINNSVFILVCACATLLHLDETVMVKLHLFFRFFFHCSVFVCAYLLLVYIFLSCDELCLVVLHDKRKYHLSQFCGAYDDRS